ncbi:MULTISPECIES: hypothetical protein [unclassified Thiocapsa]|uniref:hypothetical protein n=1 Tax=unclassified Thiocapsa TaxID=2641286 RepID=UPI0035B30BC4
MEARRLHTIDDLLAWPGEERVELIDGDIVQRPMELSAEYPLGTVPGRVRVPPFDAVEIDLAYVFGNAD